MNYLLLYQYVYIDDINEEDKMLSSFLAQKKLLNHSRNSLKTQMLYQVEMYALSNLTCYKIKLDQN